VAIARVGTFTSVYDGTYAVTKTVASGNVVVFLSGHGGTGSGDPPVSSGTATTGAWTQITTGEIGSSGMVQMYWAAVTGSGSLTVTGPSTAVTDPGQSLHEYSGVDTTAPVEASNVNLDAVGSQSTTVSLTGVSTGSVVVMISGTETGAATTYACSSPWVLQTAQNGHYHGTGDQITTGSGSFTPTIDQGRSGTWAAVAASLKVASGGLVLTAVQSGSNINLSWV
jgi:hypothetical protein